MEDYKDLEFEVGSYRCTIDILAIDGEDIDFDLTACTEMDDPQYYDFSTQQLLEDVRDFCIAKGLIGATEEEYGMPEHKED